MAMSLNTLLSAAADFRAHTIVCENVKADGPRGSLPVPAEAGTGSGGCERVKIRLKKHDRGTTITRPYPVDDAVALRAEIAAALAKKTLRDHLPASLAEVRLQPKAITVAAPRTDPATRTISIACRLDDNEVTLRLIYRSHS